MATNELLPFANGEDANVLPTAQWQALTDILENGFQSGIAKSEQVNRVLAQGAVASYVLGQLIVDQLNQNATLDETTLYQNIVKALQETAQDVCLPLSGGTMTGGIEFSQGGGYIHGHSSDWGDLTLGATTSGAWLALGDGNPNGYNGEFHLIAYNGTDEKRLLGKVNGELTWGGKRVISANDVFIANAYSATIPSGGTWSVIGLSSGNEKDDVYCATVAGGTTVNMSNYGGKKFIFAIRIS